jgi:hypothetical protein
MARDLRSGATGAHSIGTLRTRFTRAQLANWTGVIGDAMAAPRRDACGRPSTNRGSDLITEDQINAHLKAMDDFDFEGSNNTDWQGVFAEQHTVDVYLDFKGQDPTRGIDEHIDAMKAFVESAGGTPPKVVSHPIAFGSGEWTCVVGEFGDGSAW